MSIQAMTQVWKHFRRGGSEKLALLALADWCDDEGGNLFPSISTVAKKICVSDSQARRIIHDFIDEGLLSVVGNHYGGAKTQTRRYRLNLEMLTATPRTGDTPSARATPSADGTPRTDATRSTDERDPSHGCALPLAPMQANTSLTIKEPPEGKSPSKKAIGKKPDETLQAFIDRCKSEDVAPISTDDSIFEYAETVGLTTEMIEICWFIFKRRFLETAPQQRQKDWRAHFRNGVRSNWFKVWYIGDDGTAALSTPGKQAKREMKAGGKA